MKTKLLFTFLLLLSLQFAISQSVGIVGAFNGWIAPDVTLSTTDNITYTLDNWTLNADSELKFRQDELWTVNWGDPAFPSGTGTQDGPNILALAGTYNVTFNINTGAYDFATVLSIDDFNKNLSVFYINNSNTLKINGYNGQASIKTFDLYGRLLQNFENTQINNNFSQNVNLPKNQLSFIVIEGENFIKTLKVIAL